MLLSLYTVTKNGPPFSCSVGKQTQLDMCIILNDLATFSFNAV